MAADYIRNSSIAELWENAAAAAAAENTEPPPSNGKKLSLQEDTIAQAPPIYSQLENPTRFTDHGNSDEKRATSKDFREIFKERVLAQLLEEIPTLN